MTANIHAFLEERKELWLKDRVKKANNDAEILALEDEASNKFTLLQWLPEAAKRITQLSMVSHPSKFSHPSAKTSSVIVNAKYQADGYLRSGNVEYQLDVFGNAAAMDTYKLLTLKLSNGKTVLECLEHNDELIKTVFSSTRLSYEDLQQCFLSIKNIDENIKTDRLVKQVYFPVGNGEYHLLSVLTPSGLLAEIKQRVDFLQFSDETKQAKEYKKGNEYHHAGFSDIYDLTVTAYGGTQPQNISVLNSQNAGRAYLLPSVPPNLERRNNRLPNTSFFAQCLYRNKFYDSFVSLHRLMQLEINNTKIRNAIHNIISYIIDEILVIAFKIRQTDVGWSNQDYYANLSKNQRIWLDDFYQEDRLIQIDWREEISQEISRWILRSYEKSISGSYLLSNIELQEVYQMVNDAIKQDEEFL